MYTYSLKKTNFLKLESIIFKIFKDLAHWNQPGDRTNRRHRAALELVLQKAVLR
jgi:hypothetical protein